MFLFPQTSYARLLMTCQNQCKNKNCKKEKLRVEKLRQKFWDEFCEANPSAFECRIYET